MRAVRLTADISTSARSGMVGVVIEECEDNRIDVQFQDDLGYFYIMLDPGQWTEE